MRSNIGEGAEQMLLGTFFCEGELQSAIFHNLYDLRK